MSTEWKVAIIVLWIGLVLLYFITLSIVRQVGILLLRVGPRSPLVLSSGPTIGKVAPTIPGLFLTNDKNGHQTVLLFVSKGCPSCHQILQAANSVKKDYRNINLHLLNQNQFREAFSVYGISEVPYAVKIDSDGIVRMKGVVNNIDHLEEFLNLGTLDQDKKLKVGGGSL